MISNQKGIKHLQTNFLLLILTLCFLQPAYAKTKVEKIYGDGVSYAPGEVLVKFKPVVGNVESSSAVADIYQRNGILDGQALFPTVNLRNKAKRTITDLSRIYQLRVPPNTDIIDFCRQLNQEPLVEYAEPNLIMPVCAVPNDTMYFRQQHLPQIHAPEAWDISKGSKDAIMAICDTGVDWNHPDLAGKIWSNPNETLDGIDNDGNGLVDDIRGWDYVDNATANAATGEDADEPDNNPMDFEGHGTHVAGCANAVTNNIAGVAGVAWNGTIMPLRCGIATKDGNGSIYMSALAQALYYAADHGASVANISTGSVQTVAEAGRYAFENGVIISKSAGNGNSEASDPLDLESSALTVASVDDRNFKASYSSYGTWVKVSAPGGDQSNGRVGIFSTYFNDTYRELQGTSMSAPIAGGLALLMKGYNPAWTPADILMRMVQTADPIDNLNPAYAGKLGSGVINAYRALTEDVTYQPRIKLLGHEIDDSPNGNHNGIIDVGETVRIYVVLENGWGDAANVTATLLLSDPEVQVLNGTSHFATFYGLSHLSQSQQKNSTEPFILSIDPNTVPHRLKAVLNISADGYSESFEMALAINPKILVIDDDVPGRDGNNVSVENYYYDALDAIDVSYNIWDVNALQDDPRSDSLGKYTSVIWFCEKAAPSLNSSNRAAIENYIKNYSGNLIVSGQDIGWDLNEAVGDSNEFMRDSRSKTFYENNLNARYQADNAFSNQVAGVANDPIGDSLSFVFQQPGRSPALQSPDVVDTLNGSVAFLTYPDGRPAALRSVKALAGNKSSRIVYFPFGGIESIMDSKVRQELLVRSLNWLNGIHVNHLPLKDLEAPAAQEVAVSISADAPGVTWDRVELLYSANGTYPATALPMTTSGGNIYKATIPAIASGRIDYQIVVKSSDGYYAPRVHNAYNISEDAQAPTVTTLQKLYNTLDKNGPFTVSASISDNMGVDANAVYLHYRTQRLPLDSVKASPGSSRHEFAAQIAGDFSYGDTLMYYFSAKDIAQTANYAVSAEDTAVIGYEDFEHGLGAWTSDGKGPWGPSAEEPHDGSYSLADSPNSTPAAGLTTALTLNYALDLSQADDADLTFWSRNMLRLNKDYGYVEVSADDGATWIEMTKVTGLKPTWKQITLSLKGYVGTGFENLLLRFRLQTQTGAIGDNFYGWHIDDILLDESVQTGIESTNESAMQPVSFGLGQNYPNPFNPSTSIAYQLPRANQVRIQVYNTLGQRIRTLVDEKREAGKYSVLWKGDDESGSPVATGMYFYRMEAGEFVAVRKLLLLK